MSVNHVCLIPRPAHTIAKGPQSYSGARRPVHSSGHAALSLNHTYARNRCGRVTYSTKNSSKPKRGKSVASIGGVTLNAESRIVTISSQEIASHQGPPRTILMGAGYSKSHLVGWQRAEGVSDDTEAITSEDVAHSSTIFHSSRVPQRSATIRNPPQRASPCIAVRVKGQSYCPAGQQKQKKKKQEDTSRTNDQGHFIPALISRERKGTRKWCEPNISIYCQISR